MSNNIFYLAFLFLVVATNFVIVFFIKKHPEKISILKVEGPKNEIIDKTKWVNLLCSSVIVARYEVPLPLYMENFIFPFLLGSPLNIGA